MLEHDRPGSLRCTAEAFPEATYTIVGAGINRKSGSGEVSIPNVLISNHDNKVVKCTPSNEVGTGPTVELKLDVKGAVLLFYTFLFTVIKFTLIRNKFD